MLVLSHAHEVGMPSCQDGRLRMYRFPRHDPSAHKPFSSDPRYMVSNPRIEVGFLNPLFPIRYMVSNPRVELGFFNPLVPTRYRFKAADGFMTRWHRAEVEKRRLRHANEDAKKNGEKGKERGRQRGGGGGQPYTDTAVDHSRK